MSFVDLGTLTMHRRAEMEGRINTFDEKCDRAISDIKKLKTQAHSFLTQLNCDPAELKDRFLNIMKKLDEYTYLITDFNLALAQMEDISISEHTPVQDNSIKPLPLAFNFNTNNLMDALSEPAPSTSCACSNLCPPEKPKRVKVSKDEQALILFSSSSTSSESVPSRKSEMLTKEVQCSLTEELASVKLEEVASPPSPEACSLPAQTLLEVDREYHGVITVLSGACFWVITDDSQELADFMHDITEYYQNKQTALTVEQARSLTYCAYYDDETKFYYRAMSIREDQEEPDKMGLFLVDTGEIRTAAAHCLQPLAPLFSHRPPYARYCHLAGIDLDIYNDKKLMKKYENFMNDYVNAPCTFIVDENESESIGVYVVLSSGKILNDILVEQGLAAPIDRGPEEEAPESYAQHSSADVARYSPHSSVDVARYSPHLPADMARYSPRASADVAKYALHSPVEVMRSRGPPEMVASDLDIDAPEYDDPVVAVTGYHNRDEEDICKHYKGGPDKTCFKGSRCTKKHIVKHPDGWTLDRVEVVGKVQSLPLPAPDTWLDVLVTHVAHFDRVFVNIVDEKPLKEEVPEFGVVLPPKTLQGLIRDMNSAAAKTSYKPLQLTPAPGEMVAAVYPPDGRWYRARVLTVTRADQSVEVQYVDYGTVLWVKEDQIRVLDPRYCVLPTQAIQCVLAGVHMPSQNSQHWARAKRVLSDMVQDKVLHAHVIARDYDEITVDLVDNDDYSVAQQLAAQGLFELREYTVSEDSHLTHRLAVP